MTSIRLTPQDPSARPQSIDEVLDPRLVDAFRSVPRERFVPDSLRRAARLGSSLPLEHGQSMPPVDVLARMLSGLELRGGDRILEVGTGSGYSAAILSQLGAEVYTLEIQAELAASARCRLDSNGFGARIHVRCADGTLGCPEHAPFDAIVVHAAASRIPFALLSQLAPRGRLVIPIGVDSESQVLMRIRRCSSAHFAVDALGPIRLPPLTGAR